MHPRKNSGYAYCLMELLETSVFKDDDVVNDKGKIRPGFPNTPKPMVTKLAVGDDIGSRAKFHYDPIKGFCSPPALPHTQGKVVNAPPRHSVHPQARQRRSPIF